MDQQWIVSVKDEMGAAVTGAKVVVAPFSAAWDWPFDSATPAATHAHTGGGTYEATSPIVPAEGFWMLAVLVSGKSPVTQLFRMKAKSADEMATIPLQSDLLNSPGTALTVDLSSEKRTVAKLTTKRTRFAVTVFPSAEVVIVSGDEIEGQGTQFRIFAENWAKGMHNNRKKIDHGTIVTLFSCDDRARIRLVPGKGGGFVVVDTLSFGDTSGITPGRDHRPVPPVGPRCPDVSIVTVYKYLDSVGKQEPGRVKEVGIFSHSWPGGPLLFDTDDHSRTIARDPNDFDARSKDFKPANVSPPVPTNISGWPDLKRAMAPDGRWHIWGCSATTQFHNNIAAAQRHKTDGDLAMFTVPTTVTNNLHTKVVDEIQERTNRARVRARMDQQFRLASYSSAAAAFLGIPVFSAAPGLGSSFGKDDFGREFMFVGQDENAIQLAWYAENFGPELSPTTEGNDKGYVDYHRIQSRPVPPAPAFSSEAFVFDRNFVEGSTTLKFDNGTLVRFKRVTVAFPKLTAKTGFATAGKSGHLYEMIDTSDGDLSRAVFMQQDQRLFQVGRDATGQFTVLGPELTDPIPDL